MALFANLIAANRFKSCLLVAAFILFYTALIFAVVIGTVALVAGRAHAKQPQTLLLWGLLSHAAAVALAVLAASGGSRLVLAASLARPVRREDCCELHDVVEEMALAGGMRPPKVYQIDSDGLNALAVSGRRRAVVAVTRGLWERLNRDELQAVVAHQLARIKNGDVALMTLVAGLVGLTVLAKRTVRWIVLGVVVVGLGLHIRGWIESAVEQALDRLTSPAVSSPIEVDILGFIGLAFLVPIAVVVLATTPAMARLMQFCVSRERQFLADVEAARMTRYPEALATALEKMDADTTPLPIAGAATAHLFTVSPVMAGGGRLSGVWSSHPTTEERVERLRSIGGVEA